jgi:hypothetical protein
VHTKGFFSLLGWWLFWGVWEKQGGIDFVGLVAMCECQVENFLSFVLFKKIWRFFLKIKHILKIRHFHKNTNIWLSIIFLNLFLHNWLSTYNISTRATLWQPFLTMSRVVIKAQNNFYPFHITLDFVTIMFNEVKGLL